MHQDCLGMFWGTNRVNSACTATVRSYYDFVFVCIELSSLVDRRASVSNVRVNAVYLPADSLPLAIAFDGAAAAASCV